jgi:hypothetical protein
VPTVFYNVNGDIFACQSRETAAYPLESVKIEDLMPSSIAYRSWHQYHPLSVAHILPAAVERSQVDRFLALS